MHRSAPAPLAPFIPFASPIADGLMPQPERWSDPFHLVASRGRFFYHPRMKKTKPRRRSSKRTTTKRPPKNFNEYLARIPEPARSALRKMRAAIRSAVPPEATETISYRMPAFKHKGILVWFASFSGHCSLFPTAAVIEAHKHELNRFRTSKGTIQFPAGKPLPIALLKKLVKTRLAQIESKKPR